MDEFLEDLKAKFGDNLIIKNKKAIGVCECKGLGKGRCRGNGFAKHVIDSKTDEPAYDFNQCKYIKQMKSEDS